MDQREERDHSVKGCRLELDGGDVGTYELGLRHQFTGPLDLHFADVDARHAVTSGRQVSRNGHPATAAKVEHFAAWRNMLAQLTKPGPVLGVSAVRFVVAARERVISASDDLFRILSHHAAARYRTGLGEPTHIRPGGGDISCLPTSPYAARCGRSTP